MLRQIKQRLSILTLTLILIGVIAAFITSMNQSVPHNHPRFAEHTLFKCPNNEIAYISAFESQAYGCMKAGEPGQILIADPFSKNGMRWIYPIDISIN